MKLRFKFQVHDNGEWARMVWRRRANIEPETVMFT